MNDKALEKLLAKRAYWKENPEAFFKEVLGVKLAPHQKKMIKAVQKNRYTSIRSCNAIGKSFIFSGIAIWFFFCYIVDDNLNTIIIFTAPTFAQVKENIYMPILSLIDNANRNLEKILGTDQLKLFPKISENQNVAEIRYLKKNYIMGVSTEGENKNVGKHGSFVLAIYDEAQGIDDKKYSDFRGITASGQVIREVMIGNTTLPNGNSGRFYNSFQKDSVWHTMHISCFDTPNFVLPNIKLEDYLRDEKDPLYWRNKLDKYCKTNYWKYKKEDNLTQWEEDVKQALGTFGAHLSNPIEAYNCFVEGGRSVDSYEFRTRYLAEFPNDNSNALFPTDWIEQSMYNFNNEVLWQKGDIVMGVDIAKGTGADKSSIAIRNGNRIIFFQRVNLELNELLDFIQQKYIEYNVHHINIETDGVGYDKYLLLKQRGLQVNGIQSGAGAGNPNAKVGYKKEKSDEKKKTFDRKRDECWWYMRKMMNPSRSEVEESKGKLPLLLPHNEDLIKELQVLTYGDKNGKIKIVDKDTIRKKIGHSTDLADSICFACYEDDTEFHLTRAFGGFSVSNRR